MEVIMLNVLALLVLGPVAGLSPVQKAAADVTASSAYGMNMPLADALAAAKRENKILVLAFGSDDCPPCNDLERDLAANPGHTVHKQALVVTYDVYGKAGRKMVDRYFVPSWPVFVAVDERGVEFRRMAYYDRLDNLAKRFVELPRFLAQFRKR